MSLPKIVATSLPALLCLALFATVAPSEPAPSPVRVVVWDEQQPKQRGAYPNFLGNQIASYLKKQPGLSVKSVRMNDPEQGLSSEVLDNCDVLIWWGHRRQQEITPETGQALVERIRAGQLSLIALHSAHWSTPFMEAMNARSRDDALAKLPEADRGRATFELIHPFKDKYKPPKRDDSPTPRAEYSTAADGAPRIKLYLPNSCFPAVRADGMPSHVTAVLPNHPIARGIPAKFTILHTEMYDEPFHVPAPDQVVFEEHWDAGEHFRTGMVWKLGRGKVFYFRPGHETYPVYFEPYPLKILDNAVRWLGQGK